ncbi:GDSL-type esterase/lipase family protein [Corynebacterium uberis]|uniref:GDSL-type esterase/lipase family protein n=1 Tax=Corynebacterium TaxID=1716 RepID=UPI001D09A48E|nr:MULTISPECIES: GDSL-type esterase/lipase family protein [Corynebacterium]MCZ9309682.1 GDSL-type esterase/lipase family protein [Corynebacterium sp. c6VSa_13]UDL73486.1 GDSL-type esterase/lipase family protein [Corynebacterium uberis]UDL75634.1 GDSL-type esterase/lipase family protein [Corynebacterium uberis]UDL77847.1 GDSL-type esterase/lipase family protein [Corynebacterium uberis]UDL80130.1 GDSL-type esterase/lipase family protein [Corynebacterium uberis]
MRRRVSLATTLLALSTATAALTGSLAGTVASADDAHRGSIVTFGDSYSANPDQVHNELRGMVGPIGDWARNYPTNAAGCLAAPNNIPGKLAQKTGRALHDWSCVADTSGSMLPRLDAALAAGHISNDSTVVFALGMNDYGGFGLRDNKVNIFDPIAVNGAYKRNLHAAADKIRAVAPGAQIIISGAIPTTDRDTAIFCAVNVVPNMPAGVPVPYLRDVENWNRDNQRQAAAEIGATYVEMIDGARGHETCGPDAQRFVAGFIDTTTPNYTMSAHPSDLGSEYAANTVVAHF